VMWATTPQTVSSIIRKRSFLSVWPVWGWQHHPRQRREISRPVVRTSRIIGDPNAPPRVRRSTPPSTVSQFRMQRSVRNLPLL
jgi:hypothetical protein